MAGKGVRQIPFSQVDLDTATCYAAEVFGATLDSVTSEQRRAAKAINFGLMYGMSAFGLARTLGISRGDAQDYINTYFSRYPGVRDFMQHTRQSARERGYVETVSGRRLYLEYINKGTQPQRAGAERAAINAPMQGTAADIIKRAMIDIDAWLASQGDRARMILQVHDELVFEVRADGVDSLLSEVIPRMNAAADCACRWSWIPAWGSTGRKRIDAGDGDMTSSPAKPSPRRQ